MISVLLVEDEPLVSMAQQEALTEAGFVVFAADTGASAIAMTDDVNVGAAIIDMGLPDCSGLDVARELRARQPTCRF